MSSEIESLRCATENAIAGEVARLKRRGRDGGTRWCFLCGAFGPVAPCSCKYSESLGCSGDRHLCEQCREAHARICEFLTELLRTHPSPNPHSRRANLHLRLYRSLQGLGPEGDRVRRLVAQTDGGDDNEKFRGAILRAFRRASFFDFTGLQRGLDREFQKEFRMSFIRFALAVNKEKK